MITSLFRESKSRKVIRVYLKEVLITLSILLGYDSYVDRLEDIGGSIAGFGYIVLFITIFLILIAISRIRNNFIRVLFGLPLMLSVMLFTAYERITSDFMSYNMFISLLNSRAFIVDVFSQHYISVVISILSGLLLYDGIVRRPTKTLPVPDYVLVSTPVMFTVMFTVLLFVRGGDGAKALPAPFTLASYSTLAAYEALNHTVGERQGVTIPRDDVDIPYDIVYIVDESVSANYLDINTLHGVRTNLKAEYDDFKIYNYGYAAAISNCSYDVNSTLRYGGTRLGYVRINSTMPSMWAYAKAAGLKTVYIDTQRTSGKFQNGMNEEEARLIDDFIQFDDVPVMDRDIESAKTLAGYLNNDVKEFIFINKTGAHFPVHDKYPDNFMIYEPALPRGRFLNISFTGFRTGFDGTEEEWRRYRNSYKNTLTWGVGEFFATLFKQASLNNAVIIYTSDHGQDLHERGNPGSNTHCGDDPNMEEGLVPMVLLEGSEVDSLDWEKYFFENRNQTSHYNIFPTLLSLMSYDADEILTEYGKSLDTRTDDPLTFNIYFNARLGRSPKWRKVHLDQVVEPEADEYKLIQK